MKSVYEFDDQETQIISVEDVRYGHCPCRLEITTVDEETGVRITMSRSAFRDEEEDKPWEN